MPAKFGDHTENSQLGDVEDIYPLENYEHGLELPRAQSTREGMNRVQIRAYVTEDQRQELKMAAAANRTTLQGLLRGLIVRYLDER